MSTSSIARMKWLCAVALLLAVTGCDNPESRGKAHYQRVCVACHGAQGQGVGRLGTPLVTSAVLQQADDQVVAFLKAGRLPGDPANTTGMLMPPRGGNPKLTDDDLRDITAYLRTLIHPSR